MSAPASPAFVGFGEAVPPAEPAENEPPARHRRLSGSQKRQRAKAVLVPLLSEERAAVEERAATAGLSLAAYGRSCMLGDAGPRARKRPPVDRELLARTNADLNRVGNNLNQIAHALNAGGSVVLSEVAATSRELLVTLTDIRRALGYDREG
ncbi:MAG TPA: plasmid mobilization relaxosome protein MobC [Xanthobacteraceae bacterium]|jgi:hypothetical protein